MDILKTLLPGERMPTTETRVDVSVTIVNYNTETLIPEALAALKQAAAGISLQIVIIDNHSRDGSVDLIRRDVPDCELIVNRTNVGFGRANNQALDRVRGRYVLLLNTDAFVAADTLQKTIGYMDVRPRCGILGARLVGRDCVEQLSAGFFPTPWNVFLNRTGLKRFFGKVRMVDDMDWDRTSVRQRAVRPAACPSPQTQLRLAGPEAGTAYAAADRVGYVFGPMIVQAANSLLQGG